MSKEMVEKIPISSVALLSHMLSVNYKFMTFL